MFDLSLSGMITRIPALLIAFAFHEWAHAVTADHFGDPTPRSQGRLSLNPLVHLDIIGALLVLVAGFGWAKPVMTNPTYYRGNKKRADLLVSAAGPLMNFLLAFVAILVYKVIENVVGLSGSWEMIFPILDEIVFLNVILGIFNLLPIPPLDGFHVLADLLPDEAAASLYRIEQYGMMILMLVIITGITNKILGPVSGFIYNIFNIASDGLLRIFGVG